MNSDNEKKWSSCMAECKQAYEKGSFNEAENLIKSTLAQTEKESRQVESVLASMRHLYGNIERELNNFDRAECIYMNALGDANQSGDAVLKVGIMEDLALNYCLSGRFFKAIDVEADILALSERVFGGASEQSRRALATLSALFWLLDDMSNARYYLERYIEREEKKPINGNQASIALALRMLAYASFRAGCLSAAEQIYRDLLQKLSRSSDSKPDIVAIENELGLTLCAQGRHHEAQLICAHSSSLRQDLAEGDRCPSDTLNDLADVFCQQGEFASARPLCEKAMALREESSRRTMDESLTELSRLLSQLGHGANADRIRRQIKNFQPETFTPLEAR